MPSSKRTLNAFTDAAADAVARAIAGLQRDVAREREIMAAQFAARLAELEARIASVAEIERRLADRLATLKDGEPGPQGSPGRDGRDGQSVTIEDVRPIVAEAVSEAIAAMPTPKDGKDGEPGPQGSPGRDGRDGQSVTIEDVRPIVAEAVSEAIAAMPTPKDGKDGEPGPQGPAGQGIDDIDLELIEEGRVMVLRFTTGDLERSFEVVLPVGPAGHDGKDGAQGERGPEGPTGKLPIITAWEDRVYYEGEVVTHQGGVFQALRDTGKEPGCADWRCVVERGKDGLDGRSFTIRGTYSSEADYHALDVVALNSASFAARRDDPGPCPGDGWQLIAAQGKAGKPGAKGDRGDRGLAVTASVKEARISDDGVLTLVNADGSNVTCDLYPLLSRLV